MGSNCTKQIEERNLDSNYQLLPFFRMIMLVAWATMNEKKWHLFHCGANSACLAKPSWVFQKKHSLYSLTMLSMLLFTHCPGQLDGDGKERKIITEK